MKGKNLSRWREHSFCLWLHQTWVKLGSSGDSLRLDCWKKLEEDLLGLRRLQWPGWDILACYGYITIFFKHHFVILAYHEGKNRTTGNCFKNKFVGFLLEMSGGRTVFVLTWTQWLSTTEELLPQAPLTRQTLWLGRPINYRRDLKTSCFFPLIKPISPAPP